MVAFRLDVSSRFCSGASPEKALFLVDNAHNKRETVSVRIITKNYAYNHVPSSFAKIVQFFIKDIGREHNTEHNLTESAKLRLGGINAVTEVFIFFAH